MSKSKGRPLVVAENKEKDIADEMSQSFMDYAMSVIVSRALPDVRDGMKPVQRRIIYSMNRVGLAPNKRHRKCATVIGDVMARYHPHGDQSIYDALVRMGQDFSLNHPLVDPQGNFGSLEDPPAQMRYTECRLSEIAAFMLDGINEDTVEFAPNYDGENDEPTVLPAMFPNLLVNGAQGIAVGMATNIPPYNLGEVVDACIHLLRDPEASPDDLMKYVQAPDFPSGGRIVEGEGVRKAILTGRGSIKVRAVVDTAELKRGRHAIIVTELPYQVSQDRVMLKIAELVNKKEMLGVSDLRNESSSRVGIRLVIELTRAASPQVVLNQLFKRTPLESSFGANTVALVDGVPRILGVPQMLRYYLAHQLDVLLRRTRHRLKKAQEREHIVEGLCIAVDNITEVIETIRRSPDTPTARQRLQNKFKLSELQSEAVLDMPLRRLTALESEKLAEELATLREAIKDLLDILANPIRQRAIIRGGLERIRNRFAEPRRSLIIPDLGEMSIEDLIADDGLIVSVSKGSYVKSVKASDYRTQRRGGMGVKAAKLNEDDVIAHLVHTTAHSYLLFFTNRGVVHRLRAHELPRQSRTGKGVLAHAVLPLGPKERIEAIIDARDFETNKSLVFFTRKGMVKKTEFEEYNSPYKTLQAISLTQGDELVAVRPTNGTNHLLMFTEKGQGLRFDEAQVRSTGRATQGVIGIRMAKDDRLVGACTNMDGKDVLLITAKGYGKRTNMRLFLPAAGQRDRTWKRAGKGVVAIKLTKPRGLLIGARAVMGDSEAMLVSSQGKAVRILAKAVSRQGRAATGVKVMDVGARETLTTFEVVPPNGD